MVFIDINGVLIKTDFFGGCDKRWDSKLYAKKQKKMTASAERARERHFSRPLASPLVGELLFAARSLGARERKRAESALGARERNVDP